MPAPTVRATINQQVQIGAEALAARGTPVGAAKLLDAFMWTFGPKIVTKQFRGTGRQYPSASAVLYEHCAGKVSGPGDFAQTVYLLSSLYGTPTPTAHAPSTTAYDWKWTPPLVGSYASNAQSYTVQQGDVVDAEQYAFLVFDSFGYKFTRKQEMQINANWMSQAFLDGVTLTASPATVEQVPNTGAQYNVYLDTTSAGIGVTQLVDPLEVSFDASDFYDGYWPINRASSSYSNIVDKEKKHTLKLTLQANSTDIAIRGNYLTTGARAYVRVAGVGPTIDGANNVKAAFTHDMACFVAEMSELKDVDGVYGVEYTLYLAEDPAWQASGTAQILTLTNLLNAL